MTKLAAALALAVAALPPALSRVEGLRAPCDMKSTEKKTWCGTCVAYVPRADVKGGACPKDKSRVETHDVCVKTIYAAKCHPTTTGLKPVTCCGVTYDKGSDDLARIFYVCSTCKEKSAIRDYKHPPACTEVKVTRACEKSGVAPHSTIGK